MNNLLLYLVLAGLAKKTIINNKIDRRLKTKVYRNQASDSIKAIVYASPYRSAVMSHFNSCGAHIKYELPFINAYVVELKSTDIEKLASSRHVSFISDDYQVHSTLNIATKVIGSYKANELGYTGKEIGIAFIDTGIFPHPDFTKPKNRIVAFKDFVNNRSEPYDDNGHGTHCAGDAAGNGYSSNGKYRGVAPEANIISIKAMDENGSGDSSDILAGMQWIIDNAKKYNIRVVSLSFGDKTALPSSIDPLVKGCEALWRNGLVVVVAAGNYGPEQKTITTPGISPSVITVGALDDNRTVDNSDDDIADFSSRGPTPSGISKPDVIAPGVGVVSTNKVVKSDFVLFEKMYRSLSGTSMSTPIVAGAAALIIEKNPLISPGEVKRIIKSKAKHLNTLDKNTQGSGVLNLGNIFPQE